VPYFLKLFKESQVKMVYLSVRDVEILGDPGVDERIILK
jgi:hypothetical protein